MFYTIAFISPLSGGRLMLAPVKHALSHRAGISFSQRFQLSGFEMCFAIGSQHLYAQDKCPIRNLLSMRVAS